MRLRARSASEAAARMREAAGAIILGKTTTTEFACADPAGTRNPWKVDHTPGGSSSGSAAAWCEAVLGFSEAPPGA